jgi:4-carboxymuconolactone decarboxylase
MTGQDGRLRRLAIHDPAYLEQILTGDLSAVRQLAPHDLALIRIGVLVALDGPRSAFEYATSAALAAGASPDELVDVLIAAAPLVGSAHVVSAAPRLARALGYDLDADLEGAHLGPRDGR